MKTFWVLLWGISIMLTVSGLHAEVIDGFRGVKCGDPFDNWQKEMTLEAEASGVIGNKFYTRKNDLLEIGNDKLLQILYSFWEDKFEGAIIGAKGYGNCDSLKAAAIEKFGKDPDKPNKFMEDYFWKFGSLQVCYGYKKIPETCSLAVFCWGIIQEKDKKMEEKAKEGAKSGF